MNIMFILLLIIFLAFAGVIGWTLYGFYKDHKVQIHHIMECRSHKKNKDALLIDYYRLDPMFSLDNDHGWMDHTYTWYTPKKDNPDEPYEDIYRMGYLSAEKWMTNLRYIGIPVFVKMHNFKIIDPRTMDPNKYGHKQNKITSNVLGNTYKARTAKKYIAGMSKAKFAEMDVKTLGFLIPIILGIGVGIVYFVFFGGKI